MLDAQAKVCRRCGTANEEWMDPERPGRYKAIPPYEVAYTSCIGCDVLRGGEKKIPKDKRDRVVAFLRRWVPEREDDDT